MTEVLLEDRLLECGICFEMLNETCKMLPCQHTYCKACLEGIRQHEGCLRCPQCRTVIEASIDGLPKNLMLLNLIEQVKNKPPPPGPKVEEDELAKAMTISMEEFMKESATNLLLKHNEQLQTQLALENSKRDALLASEKQISDDYNELLQFQVAMDQSEEEESFKRRNQNLLSEKEKLECQLVLLKSEMEANTARSLNSSSITSLFSWFAKNIDKISEDQREEAQKGLESLTKAVGKQFGDQSTLTQLQLLIENIKKNDGNKSLDSANRILPTTLKDDGDEAIDDVMKNLRELKTMLRQEGQNQNPNKNDRRNYLYPQIPPLMEDTRAFHSKSRFHVPRPQMPAHASSKEGPHHSRHFQYFPPPIPSLFYRPPTFSSKFGVPNEEEARNFSTHGRNARGYRGGRGRGGPAKSAFEKMGFDKLQNAKKGFNEYSGSLILPDVRDYERLDENLDGNLKKKSECENRRDFSPSSSGEIRGQLMLPDVRHYDVIYSKFRKSTDTTDDTKCDSEFYGSDFKGRHETFESNSDRKPGSTYRGRKPYRGRGGKVYNNRSRSKEENDGFESDSSATSMVSCSSHLSTASTPAGPSATRRNKPFRGNKHKKRNSDHPNSRKASYSYDTARRNDEWNRHSHQKDDMKRLIYPSKSEALHKNMDLTKHFETPVICLGKDGNKPVSQTVECLADVYEFEGKYKDCKVIRI